MKYIDPDGKQVVKILQKVLTKVQGDKLNKGSELVKYDEEGNAYYRHEDSDGNVTYIDINGRRFGYKQLGVEDQAPSDVTNVVQEYDSNKSPPFNFPKPDPNKLDPEEDKR